jgi:hypothetical protein
MPSQTSHTSSWEDNPMRSASSVQMSPSPQNAPIDARPSGPSLQHVTNMLLTRIGQLKTNINFLEAERRKQATIAEVVGAITKAITEKKERARVPLPMEYDGTKDKLPIFFKEVKTWLEDNKVTEDDGKMRLTMAYLKKGEGAEWSTQQVEDEVTWESYDDFLNAIQARFRDIDPKYTARQKLSKVKQTGSVETYSSEFRKYAKKTGFSDEDLSDKYQRGLNNEILYSIYHSKMMPTSLDGWIERSLHFDRLSEQLRQVRPGARNILTEKVGCRTFEPQPQVQTTAPKVHTESDYKPGTTGPMDINRAKREKVCCFCGQPWEIGHACEKKKLAQTAYEQRVGKQKREVQTEVDLEGLIASMRDELNLVKKELKEVKDDGD